MDGNNQIQNNLMPAERYIKQVLADVMDMISNGKPSLKSVIKAENDVIRFKSENPQLIKQLSSIDEMLKKIRHINRYPNI